MENEKLETLFDKFEGKFDVEEPKEGHQLRFLEKLQSSKSVVDSTSKKHLNWKYLSIAASLLVLMTIGFSLYSSNQSVEAQIAEISPEASQTQFYFASLIEEQVKELEKGSTAETQFIIDDTLIQLRRLESNYKTLEQDLINGGNQQLILSAMITNFQTRIDLLEDVLGQIENIKTLKNKYDANSTI